MKRFSMIVLVFIALIGATPATQGGWTAVQLQVYKEPELEATPLEIKTDSAVGSGDEEKFKSSSSPSGSVWLCYECYRKNDLALMPSQPSQAANLVTMDESESGKEADNEVDDRVSPRRNRESVSVAFEETVCDAYKRRQCPHGLTGKRLIDGQPCKFKHPPRCFRWCKHGDNQRLGCTKGNDCKYLHPKLCRNSVLKRYCPNQDCSYHHLKHTRRPRDPAGGVTGNKKVTNNGAPGKHERGNSHPDVGETNGISSVDSGFSEGADKNDPTHPPNLSSTIPASTPVPIPPIGTHSARSTRPQFPDSVCRLLLLNSRSISPAASGESRWKLPFIQSTLLEDRLSPPVLVLGITETWLSDSVSDAQTEIKDYQCIRSDRVSRRGGGCALYLHSKVVPSDQLIVSDSCNNLVAMYSESLHLIIAVVYRPPDSPDCDFSSCIEKLQQFICDHSKDEREADVAVNYHKADFTAMNEALDAVNWVLLKALCDDCGDADSTLFKELIVLTVLQITLHLSPSKISLDKKGKSKLDKELASLKMKKRKANRKLHHLQNTDPSSRKIPELERSNLELGKGDSQIITRKKLKKLDHTSSIFIVISLHNRLSPSATAALTT
ncbi:hypothetical protein ACHWQZ_G002039 [Mnemiopsis leidyi]